MTKEQHDRAIAAVEAAIAALEAHDDAEGNTPELDAALGSLYAAQRALTEK